MAAQLGMRSPLARRTKLVPANPELWRTTKEQARAKFVWPSPCGSAWLVGQYKRAGGGFLSPRPETSALRRHIARARSSGVSASYWPTRERVWAAAAPARERTWALAKAA